MSAHIGIAQWLGEEIDGLVYAEDNTANVFVDRLPTAPDKCVAVFTQGGFEADSKLPYDSPTMQIIVRSDASPAWATSMWWAIYHKLQALRYKTLPNGVVLVYALVVQSSPTSLGADKNDRLEYAMNLRTEVYNPTEERP